MSRRDEDWRVTEMIGMERETRASSMLAEIDFLLGGSWGELEDEKWEELAKRAASIADHANALHAVCEEESP